MPCRLALFLCLAVSSEAPAALAEDAQSVLDTMQQKQLERWDGVDTYVIHQSMMGHSTTTVMARTVIDSDSGHDHTLFLPVSNRQLESGNCVGPQRLTPEQLEQFASAQEMAGDALATDIEDGLEAAGLPRGMLAASGSTPQATFDPRVMMRANAGFLRAAADAERQEAGRAERDAATARQSDDQMALFMASARLAGTEAIDGRDAYHLRADDPGIVQASDDQEFQVNRMSLWVDVEHHVPLRMQIDGTLFDGNETRPMTIESLRSDYRTVPGSKMYEPYRLVTRMAGVLSPEQEAEMRNAQAEMARLEQQLSNMPESQRAMMESMVGPQLETMRNMASGSGFETELVVQSIEINPATLAGTAGEGCGSGALYEPASTGILARQSNTMTPSPEGSP